MRDDSSCVKCKLSSCSVGVAFGITKGLCLMLLAWVGMYFGYGMASISQVASVYPGYAASFTGGLIGAGYGLVVGFIFGFVFGYIYNWSLRFCCKA